MLLRDDERIDDWSAMATASFQRKGAFCFGMDAVLLSGFAVVKPGETAGPGHRHRDHPHSAGPRPRQAFYRPGDSAQESADMARRSVAYNRLEEKVDCDR